MNIANESGSAEVVKTKVGEVSLPVDPQTSVNIIFKPPRLMGAYLSGGDQCVAASTKTYGNNAAVDRRTGVPATAHLLEIGCGAGFATVALARRGIASMRSTVFQR